MDTRGHHQESVWFWISLFHAAQERFNKDMNENVHVLSPGETAEDREGHHQGHYMIEQSFWSSSPVDWSTVNGEMLDRKRHLVANC